MLEYRKETPDEKTGERQPCEGKEEEACYFSRESVHDLGLISLIQKGYNVFNRSMSLAHDMSGLISK